MVGDSPPEAETLASGGTAHIQVPCGVGLTGSYQIGKIDESVTNPLVGESLWLDLLQLGGTPVTEGQQLGVAQATSARQDGRALCV